MEAHSNAPFTKANSIRGLSAQPDVEAKMAQLDEWVTRRFPHGLTDLASTLKLVGKSAD